MSTYLAQYCKTHDRELCTGLALAISYHKYVGELGMNLGIKFPWQPRKKQRKPVGKITQNKNSQGRNIAYYNFNIKRVYHFFSSEIIFLKLRLLKVLWYLLFLYFVIDFESLREMRWGRNEPPLYYNFLWCIKVQCFTLEHGVCILIFLFKNVLNSTQLAIQTICTV